MSGAPDPVRLVSFDTFQVDLATGKLSKQGRKIKLQGQPFELLSLLEARPPRRRLANPTPLPEFVAPLPRLRCAPISAASLPAASPGR